MSTMFNMPKNFTGIATSKMTSKESENGVEEVSITLRHYLNGRLHREDGPAVEHDDGSNQWWINGRKLTEEEFNQWLAKKHLNEKLHITLDVKPVVKKGKI